jgi:nicotinamidase-related amidase
VDADRAAHRRGHGSVHGVPRDDVPRLLLVRTRGAAGADRPLKDALLLVDVVQDFRHEDGERLLGSFRERHGGLVAALEEARSSGVAVIYANDNEGIWDGNAARLVRRAVDEGRGSELVAAVAPQEGDRFVVKPRYSAFDHTPLDIVLRELEIERILLAGTATEGCVVQTAIDAREKGFKVTVLTDACATNDPRLEQIALEYLEEVVGARLSGAHEPA